MKERKSLLKASRRLESVSFVLQFTSGHREAYLMQHVIQPAGIIEQPGESQRHIMKETCTNFT